MRDRREGRGWQEEYPRPQMRRDSFFSLNGIWSLNERPVRVPFPPEAALSGYAEPVEEHLVYKKTFTLPDGFTGRTKRVLLHFGAVDQLARVMLNGREMARHAGGYLPFSVDITDALCPGENRLRVDVIDKLSHDYPYGKQSKKPGGMWYTPVSGIWQSVWLEAVPERGAVSGLRVTPGLYGIDWEVDTDAPEYRLTVSLASGPFAFTCREKRVHIDWKETGEAPHWWTPEDPFLYLFTVETDTDRVESYFALRTVEIRRLGGKQWICLNGRPVFLHGVLDQGYFADGHYLPGEPDEYTRDIRRMKELGFCLLRKHVKIEPEAFYYACDREGMLVWQDMVNNGGFCWLMDTALPNLGFQKRPDRLPGGRRRKRIFERHLRDTLTHLYNHPCIVGYTIFNEGWGQFDSDRMAGIAKEMDATRLYDATSGWFSQKKSDVDSIHAYFRNRVIKAGKKPLFLSECGGYVRKISGHLYREDAKYGYGKADSKIALTKRISALYREMVIPSIFNGLCGCVYTQLSDVEGEVNGLYTYDRQVCKVDIETMQALAGEIRRAFSKAVAERTES